jgi:hypothetical protein
MTVTIMCTGNTKEMGEQGQMLESYCLLFSCQLVTETVPGETSSFLKTHGNKYPMINSLHSSKARLTDHCHKEQPGAMSNKTKTVKAIWIQECFSTCLSFTKARRLAHYKRQKTSSLLKDDLSSHLKLNI